MIKRKGTIIILIIIIIIIINHQSCISPQAAQLRAPSY
jgi:hypothetical protein